MKKFLSLLFALLLLLCSCGGGKTEESTITEYVPETADTGILFSAAGFENVYDEELGATWIYRAGIESGFFTRILVYNSGNVSLRIICTDALSFEYGGVTYEIKDGDMSADKNMINVLQNIADGGECKIDVRYITEEEREALSDMLRLYKASYAGIYEGETKSVSDVDPEKKTRIYESDKYSIKYPSGYTAEENDGSLTITSNSKESSYISIRYTDADFSPVIADKESVKNNVTAQGGKLISDITKTSLNGSAAYKYCYVINGVYITQYLADGGRGTYIITAGTYEKNDIVAETIVYTFKLK